MFFRYPMCQITFPMFHDSLSQRLMWGPSCSRKKNHFLRAPGMTMGKQIFSYQSWETEDRLVFPGIWPIRKEMERTQDVLSSVPQHTAVKGRTWLVGQGWSKHCSQGFSPHHHSPCSRLHDGVGFLTQVFHYTCPTIIFFFHADICQIWPDLGMCNTF